MIGNKKIIGICLTKAEDDFRTDFLTYMHRITSDTDYKIIAFNSPRDLYYGDKYDIGSKSVYNIINYELLDVVVIMYESFYDKETIEKIITGAHKHKVPVILVHGEHENCFSIVTNYTEAYKDIIRHIIKHHHVKNPVFLGGRKTDDPSTVLRHECFKEVLAEFGIPYRKDMLYYGEYWDVPTKQAVKKILSGETVPDAVVCANDTMAMTVCDELAAAGHRVPEDIVVTGFDGLISTEYFMPRLTTCKEDIPALTELTFEVIEKAVSGTMTSGVFTENFIPYFSESCGCANTNAIDYRERAKCLYKRNYDVQQHENHIYELVDSILDSENLNTLGAALRNYILPNSSVCLSEDFIMNALGNSSEKIKEQKFGELIVITSMDLDYSSGKQGRYPITDMLPDIKAWADDNTMCVISPIFVGEEVCGYYTLKTDHIDSMSHKLFRVLKTMNIAFNSLINRLRKKRIQSSMQNARFMDTLTGLPNLRGLTQWFSEYTEMSENHSKPIMVSVYSIPQYKFIYENYGVDDIEQAVKFVAEALQLANKDNGYVARTGSDEFIIINYVDDTSEVGQVINNAVSVFYGVIEGYNTASDKDYFLEVNCGCTVADPGWNSSLSTFIKLANAEMYMNKLKSGLTPVLKEERILASESPDAAAKLKDLYSAFNILIDKNLFTYFFQPIVDAKTGVIYAYEALMRTTGGIKMSPIEILDVAKEYNRLYEIEKATMFNVMERYATDLESFANTKVFINTIPGNFLKEDDLELLKSKYGKYIDNFVIEITEQDTVTDDELEAIRHLGIVENTEAGKETAGGQLAVDDYGTGHSNIVNLLRYAPHVIKIDRFLITNIQNDPNKQMFVKSTIEFAKMNNIKILAEGVETFEEMKTVIDYGVDLIQGYYTARPAPEPIGKIPENIRREIITENINLSKYAGELLTYNTSGDETLDLYEITLQKYSSINISGGKVKIIGTPYTDFETEITIDPDASAEITLENVRLKATHGPIIKLGNRSKVSVILSGENAILNNGILVPKDTFLNIGGSGNLAISVKHNNGVGIGSGHDNTFGSVSFTHTGKITVDIAIEQGVCIGGGIPSKESDICFKSGITVISTQCVNSVGVGSMNGKVHIHVSQNASVTAKCNGNQSVAVGSFNGSADIYSCGTLDLTADGNISTACGTLEKGRASIMVAGGSINAVVHGDRAVCLGTIAGNSKVSISAGRVYAYGEGNTVCGYGSIEGIGTNYISGGTAKVKILSGHVLEFGTESCTTVITGGNILSSDNSFSPVNDRGDPLHLETSDETKFFRTVSGKSGEYIYQAERLPEDDKLCVYLP